MKKSEDLSVPEVWDLECGTNAARTRAHVSESMSE